MPTPPLDNGCWRAFLATVDDPDEANRRFYETFRIGDTPASADEGAALICAGIKTATSSLLWEYEAGEVVPPAVGSLSLVEDGSGRTRCVVESTEIIVQPYAAVDAQFAADYGEWDRTLTTWRAEIWRYYAAQCAQLGRTPSAEMPLVCERLRVVFLCAD